MASRKKADDELKKTPLPSSTPDLSKEAEEKLKAIKTTLDSFKKKALEKFETYIMGITLLPPPKPKEGKKVDKDLINIMLLVDDSDSKKMTKYELRSKLQSIMEGIAKGIDKKLVPDVVLLSELWQNCYDAKYDLLELVAMGAPIHDTGMLAAVKIAEMHKRMVLKKFEKYIVSYVLAGSLTQGRATPSSDIDVWVVIDDTDVKKMTRVELKDKLRAIIVGMGIEAGDMSGIKNKLNIQVYILTDFWDSLKEANPVIFTLLRDGVPFYDRGIFMPWKQLLRMGKIKPSPEAIDMFMSSGDSMLKRVTGTLKALGMEDTYYAILSPSQAALMLYGIPPPAPSETANLMRDIFVRREKLLTDKDVDILARNIKVRKDLEHGDKKELSGKDVDTLLSDAEKYLKRIKRLFTQIEKRKEEESVVKIHDDVLMAVRDVLRAEGHERVEEADVIPLFESEIIGKGLMAAKHSRILSSIVKAKSSFEEGTITKQEIGSVRKDSAAFIRALVEHLQRKRGREIERAKIRVKHGEKFGEVLLLGKEAFIITDLDAEEREVKKARINAKGGLSDVKKSSYDELEKALAKAKLPDRVYIKEPVFEDLKGVFGGEIDIMVSR